MVPWKPTPAQRSVARLLAIGYPQTAAAEALGQNLRTVQRWCADEQFEAYIDRLYQTAWERVEPGIMANVELAIEVQRQMLRGEVKPNDPRYREAARLLDRILDRLLYVEPASAGGDAAGIAAVSAVNVNVVAAGGGR